MEKRIILVAIIENDGKYLLTRQSEKGRQSGYWGFPGGNLDEDEVDLGVALSREIREEVGLVPAAKVLIGAHVEVIARNIQLLFLYYLVEARSNNVRPGSEIEEYKWLELSELEQIKAEEIRPPFGWFQRALEVIG